MHDEANAFSSLINCWRMHQCNFTYSRDPNEVSLFEPKILELLMKSCVLDDCDRSDELDIQC